jgi:hypothetical protein
VPHRGNERKAGAILRGDDGNQGRYVNWLTFGWPIQHMQPPHPRPERSGVQAIGHTGIELPYILWTDFGWFVPQPQPPQPKWARSSSEAPFVVWLDLGDVAPPPEIDPTLPPMIATRNAGSAVGRRCVGRARPRAIHNPAVPRCDPS